MAVVMVAAFGVVAGGCSKAGRSLVRADVSAAPSVQGLATVRLRVSVKNVTLATQSFAWTSPKISVGVFLPDSATGAVTVEAAGLDASGLGIAVATADTSVQPGAASAVVSLVLQLLTPSPDGGTDGNPDVTADGPASDGQDRPSSSETGCEVCPDVASDTKDAAAEAPPPETAADMGSSDLPVVVTNPPSLSKCLEIEHAGPKAMCDENTGVGDWAVYSVAFSPDGTLAATAGGDSRVKLWKVNGTTLSPEGRVISAMLQGRVAFSPDGKILAVGGDQGDLFLYDLTTNLRTTLAGHTDRIRGVAFRSDGTRLVTVDRSGVVKVWDVGTHQAVATVTLFGGMAAPWSLAIVKHTTGAALWAAVGLVKIDTPGTGTGGTLPSDAAYVWFGDLMNPAQSRLLNADTDEVDAVAISPDDRVLLAGGTSGIAHVWDIQTPTQPNPGAMIPAPLNSNQEAIPLAALAFGADGRFVAAAHGASSYGGSLRIIDAGTWQQRTFTNSTYYGVSVALRPQGDIFLAGEISCGLVEACAD
jgi:WD40 repeat protein